ncbi:MAG: hypothetical protein JSV52_11615 [Candidatus Zixiibacteriota bacterium]|nr:MAG: hypothetical protein JSV52_11615 [candidate division Zixibacteria bacterium]
MFAKQINITIIAVLMLCTGAFAQGEFVKPGENALGVYGGAAFYENSDAYSLGFGYSLKGRFDFSFAVTSDNDVDAQSYTVSATYYVKHFHKLGMFGMGVTLGYASLQGGGIRDVNVLLLGVVVFNNLYVSRDLALQPYLSGTVWRNNNAAVGTGQLGITADLLRRAPVRPLIGAGIGSSDGQSYTTVHGGLVVVF